MAFQSNQWGSLLSSQSEEMWFICILWMKKYCFPFEIAIRREIMGSHFHFHCTRSSTCPAMVTCISGIEDDDSPQSIERWRWFSINNRSINRSKPGKQLNCSSFSSSQFRRSEWITSLPSSLHHNNMSIISMHTIKSRCNCMKTRSVSLALGH